MGTNTGFVHLHVHTEHSPLDGLSKLADACEKVAADGNTAMSINDHGNLGGAWKFAAAARKVGIKPIIGYEGYLALSDDWRNEPNRHDPKAIEVERDDETSGDLDEDETAAAASSKMKTKRNQHITLLVKNAVGWTNLLLMVNKANESFWGKPLMDFALLKEHGEGIIVLTGCLGGPVLGPISRGEEDEARANLARIIDAVGKENVFVEIMEHGIPAETAALPKMAELAAEFGLDMVATNDAHYVHADQAKTHEAWLAVRSGKTLDDPKRFQFHGAGFHLRTEQEMRELRTEGWWQTAVSNSVKVAALCADVVPAPKMRLPEFPVPEGFATIREYYVHLVKEGAIRKYGTPLPDPVKKRLQYELSVIEPAGFMSYFLIVMDVINWARAKGIRVGPGRGSAAGSLTSYCLGIVAVDPLENNLLFERFLEPGRKGMPDIDVDFEQKRRHEVLQYLAERWGSDRVARIGSFSAAKTRRALRDAARLLEQRGIGDALSKAVPIGEGGQPYDFAQLADEDDPAGRRFRDLLGSFGDAGQAVVELAKGFAGTVNGDSIHACGTLIADTDLRSLVPLREDRSKSNSSGLSVVTQWDGVDIDQFGLLKLDVLGLRNLDVVSKAAKFIEQTTGEIVDPDNLPHPNTKHNSRVAATWELLRSGRTSGIFQMECVSGDTLVGGREIAARYAAQEMGEPTRTLESVYIDEGKKHRNLVKRIVKSGAKEVFRLVTESGRYIEATAGHKFMTTDGWMTLGDIPVGMEVLVDQTTKTKIFRTCVDCGAQLASDYRKASIRCYKHSAEFHSNPTKNGEKIRAGIVRGYQEGRVTWNLGLNTDNSAVMAATGAKISMSLAGRTWDELHGPEKAAELRSQSSVRMRGRGNHMFGRPTPHAKGGFREDIGHYVRSTWEADYARVLIFTKQEYVYEKQTFLLTRENGSELTYTPDFWLPAREVFVEVKGFMRDLDREKISLFQEQYPEYPLEVIWKTEFAELAMSYKHLVAWECPVKPETTEWEAVVSISPIGVRETYDIAMEGPAHNYLANGFMVHNSGGMSNLSRQIQPDCLSDLSAIVALFRPGPLGEGMHLMYADRKSGEQAVSYTQWTEDPAEAAALDSVLGETYGVFVYQEQLMRLGTVVSGFDVTMRSKLRKAVGKKIKSEMAMVGEALIEGAPNVVLDEATGEVISMAFSRQTASKLYESMKYSASYLFNASHSFAYAQLSYVTAYLKANWPAEYGAAILAVTDNDEKRQSALRALAEEGIDVQAPDVNRSHASTYPVGTKTVLLGLSEIKSVGQAGAAIAEHRLRTGTTFTSIHDLMTKVISDEGKALVDVGAVENLIQAGALDSFGPRLGLMRIARASKLHEFEVPEDEWGVLERSTRQRQRLGVIMGAHPLDTMRDQIVTMPFPLGNKRDSEFSIGQRGVDLGALPSVHNDSTFCYGVLAEWSERAYSKGRMANFTLESADLSVRGVLWDDTLTKMRSSTRGIPAVGSIVIMSGKVQIKTQDLEDEEGNVLETIETKELMAFQMVQLDVNDGQTATVGAAVRTPLRRHLNVVAERPAEAAVEVPAAAPAAAPTPERAPVTAGSNGGAGARSVPVVGTVFMKTAFGPWTSSRDEKALIDSRGGPGLTFRPTKKSAHGGSTHWVLRGKEIILLVVNTPVGLRNTPLPESWIVSDDLPTWEEVTSAPLTKSAAESVDEIFDNPAPVDESAPMSDLDFGPDEPEEQIGEWEFEESEGAIIGFDDTPLAIPGVPIAEPVRAAPVYDEEF